MGFFTNLLLKNQINKNNAFVWNANKKKFIIIEKIHSIDLKLLVGIDKQKNKIFENTNNFALGNFTNNALLWGSRGNGKSTLIKSVFLELSKKYNNLKLVQLNKDNITDIEKIYPLLGIFKNMRFIIFIDDLSFEKIDSEYKIIKSTLDGSLLNQPTNIILYVTSNRRHLMPRDMIDNERSSAIHTDESVEEKISLSDRFGLWIGFHNLNQDNYLKIVEKYCKHFKIEFNEEIISNAIERNYERWDDFIGEYIWIEPEPVPESYDEEISTMKNWISNRLVWMDMEMPGDCNNTNFEEANIYDNKNIFMIVDLLGRPAYNTKNQALIYIYNDGKVQKKFIK